VLTLDGSAPLDALVERITAALALRRWARAGNGLGQRGHQRLARQLTVHLGRSWRRG
jgi:hypothetical protein